MNRMTVALTALALTFAFATPTVAHHAEGHVVEILIKVMTKDGEKYYRVGEDVELTDIKPGDYVHFDYADDGTIEDIYEGASGQSQSKSAD